MPRMTKRDEMIAGAMRLFQTEGFRGIGVDAILAPSGASTRTLYKHFASREGLVAAVLEERHRAFMEALRSRDAANPLGALFDTLDDWAHRHASPGCMLLRARSEYISANPQIARLVERQKAEYRQDIAARVAAMLGREDAALSTQVWMLVEGFNAIGGLAGDNALALAREAAFTLLAAAGRQAP
ncbi:TetR/AcrR family transcriptional regulator [Aureimonas frigidaquae]|uniref:TetR/AcrR family transcriptional regulator n=1 Tax=Aureimonas frigidaquae TaxID=424757 RepID=UPI000A982C22|nr:TetR/AcrR family transcriptional regulator [Aureimonas frigidaquae]